MRQHDRAHDVQFADRGARDLRRDLHAYLARESKRALDPLRRLVPSPNIGEVVSEIGVLEAYQTQAKPGDRKAFDRREIRSEESTRDLARDVGV